MRRKERSVLWSCISVVGKHNNAEVLVGAYHAPRRLKHVVHSGIGVRVIVARRLLALVVEIFADDVLLVRKSGKSHAEDDRADKSRARQVNALREHAAKHTKADAAEIVARKIFFIEN